MNWFSSKGRPLLFWAVVCLGYSEAIAGKVKRGTWPLLVDLSSPGYTMSYFFS